MIKFRSIFITGFLISNLVVLLLVSSISKAQTVEQLRIDSMLKKLPPLKEDTGKVKLLNDISFTFFTVNPDEGIRYGEQGKALAEKLGWQKGLAGAYHSLGANYWAKHELFLAQSYYWKCLKINERLENKVGIAKSLHDLALIYETQYNYPKALEYYQRALIIYNDIGDKFAKLGCLANIANIYQVQGNYKLALDYFMQSLALCEEYGNERHIAYMWGRVGSIYLLQGEYDLALDYEFKSLKSLEKFPDKSDIAAVLENIGEVYKRLHNYSKSLEYFKQALKISESVKSNNARGYAGKYSGYIGYLYISMATNEKQGLRNKQRNINTFIKNAVYYLKKGIKISGSVGDKESLRDCYQSLSKAQSLQGDYAASLESFKKFSLYKDSLANVEKDKQMNRHELEYVYAKQKDSLDYINKLQETEVQNLLQERKLARFTLKQQWLYSILAFITICLFGSYFFYRSRTKQIQLRNELAREKAEKLLKESEYQRKLNDISFSVLRSQMNPHFIFNALNTIQSFVYSNDKKSASNYLGKFSELIRKILDNSKKEFISLDEEIHLIQLYIDIEKVRFGDTFNAVIETNSNLDTENIFVPTMLIQPYVENAIKHGLLHLSGEKKLLIKINKSLDQNCVEVKIDDNGIGREKSLEINKNRFGHHSFANEANEQRIDLINQMSDEKTILKILDKKNAAGTAAGTTVIISIPLMAKAEV